MKIETSERYDFILKEVYGNLILETSEGNQMIICMRDDTFEFCVKPKGDGVGVWKRVNMQKRSIEKL